MQPPLAQAQAQQENEKSLSSSSHVYGTFLTFVRKPRSILDVEKRSTIGQQTQKDNVLWALVVSLLVVGTIAVYAFVIVSAIM